MSQSLSRILVHLVFSTKDRAPLLGSEVREDLHRYLSGILRRVDCVPLQSGGVEDHVHMLFALSRTRAVAHVVETVKRGSSKWLKAQGVSGFRWQNGYGIFSVDEVRAALLVDYIRRQQDHHRLRSYQDELRILLRRHGVEFDERYLWD